MNKFNLRKFICIPVGFFDVKFGVGMDVGLGVESRFGSQENYI